MSLMFDGSERDTIIINKNVYKFAYVERSANAQNTKYRGKSLGAFTEDYATNIKNGDFDSMQVGDTFTQNGHTYKIGGFNYLCGADHNSNLGNHLIMITGNLGDYPMNSTETTDGGFAGSDMWESTFPNFVEQFKTDFGNHLLTWNEFLTTGINGHDDPGEGKYFAVQASMMNTVMYWGFPRDDFSFANKDFNIGIEKEQLPIMKLHPDELKNDNEYAWQRDVFFDDGPVFAATTEDGYAASYAPDTKQYLRAFFLVD